MADAVTQTMIDIQPSPRILTVLGDIEFKEWQCVAELVDNAFDDFLDIKRAALSWPDGFLASVTVPTMATAAQEAEIIVRDTGRGMDLDTLNDAVRAGWSSNDRFTKLGLFGIGFNIATARLGQSRASGHDAARRQRVGWDRDRLTGDRRERGVQGTGGHRAQGKLQRARHQGHREPAQAHARQFCPSSTAADMRTSPSCAGRSSTPDRTGQAWLLTQAPRQQRGYGPRADPDRRRRSSSRRR